MEKNIMEKTIQKMGDSLGKFIDFLEEYKKEQSEKIVKYLVRMNPALSAGSLDLNKLETLKTEIEKMLLEKNAELKEMNRQYSIADSLLDIVGTELASNSDGMIFSDFDILSDILSKSKLSAKDKTNIIIFFVLANWNKSGGITLTDAFVIDANDVKKHKFKTMDTQEALALIYSLAPGCQEDQQKPIKRTKEEQEKINEIYQFFDESTAQKTNFFLSHAIINEFYLKKMNTFMSDDKDKVLEQLKDLGVSAKILSEISAVLDSEIRKRTNKANNNKPINWQKQKSTQKKFLTEAEYKKLRKDLGVYYDTYHGRLKKQLTDEEKIYCVSLMMQLDFSDDRIQTFLERVKRASSSEEKKELSTLAYFAQNYEKFLYYSKHDKSVKKYLDLLLEYASNTLLVDDEEYSWMKSEIKSEVHAIEDIIQNKCDYEKHLAKKQIKR